jgi:NadR type nicotinamide-nucleotide adenylyltransferase
MEKGFTNAIGKKSLKVVITGPESTGKSTLAESLAVYYRTVFIPEYARTFVENLARPYNYDDLEHIARHQVQDMEKFGALAHKILFADTFLIITKVWFNVVYKKIPAWLDDSIKESDIDLFLLCSTDVPWQPDPVRENGGKMRESLFQQYKTELELYGFNYRIVEGLGENRLINAIGFVDELLAKNID